KLKLFRGVVFTMMALDLALSAVHAANAEGLSEADINKRLEAKLHFQQGEVNLPTGIAKLSLPPGFRYLNPADSQFVLVNLWGNPPGPKTLGMIFPSDLSLISSNTWGVVITFSDDGYIKDSDADSINYDQLLKEMQKAVAENNKERVKQGFGTTELVG